MKLTIFSICLTTAALSVGSASARVQNGDASALALDRALSPAIQPLTVASPAASPSAQMADVFTAFGKNVSPPVSWDDAPPGARSFVVVMEDPDAHGGGPALHWLAYNIPAKTMALRKNIHNQGELKSPAGMRQGINYAGGTGYIGPHPPAGDPPHHYHIEVFALDQLLRVGPRASLDAVIAAMDDHVLAEGETVATFVAPADK